MSEDRSFLARWFSSDSFLRIGREVDLQPTPSRHEMPRRILLAVYRLPAETRLLLASMTIVAVAGLLVFEFGLQ